MTIATLHRVFSRTVLLLGFTALVACGGGGGGGDNTTASRSSNSTAGTSSAGISSSMGVSSLAPSSSSASSIPLPDTIPNSFSFNSVTGVELSAVTPSEAVTISGINTLATVSVTGGEYSIDGAAFTAIDGQVSNGQTLAVRLTASAVHSTTSSATVAVGGVSASFSVTTKADTTPEAFSFEPVTDAALDTVYTSNVITITGIDAAVPITVTGGEYAINSEETFTSAAGTVSANNTVRLRGTSAPGNNLTHAVVVTIGGVSATYSITTIPDTTPPVAEFKFPTPYTMSEANTVKVRGIATDDNTITSVKVVVRSFKLDTPDETIASTEFEVTPKAEIDGVKDFSSWTADIPLTALAENEIKVIATDENDNTIANEDANKVTIRQADVASAFPDEVNQADIFTGAITLDYQSERNRLLVSGRNQINVDEIYAIDLATGKRTIAISVEEDMCSRAEGLVVDPQTQHLFVFCNDYPTSILREYNLSDGQLVATYNFSEYQIYGVALDRNNGRNQLVLVVYLNESNAIYSDSATLITFDLDTMATSVLSKAGQQPYILEAQHLAVDGDRYLVTTGGFSQDVTTHSVIAINAITGDSSILSSNLVGTGELFSSESSEGYMAALTGIALDSRNGQLLVNEVATSKLFAIDKTTGKRIIFKDLSYVQLEKQSLVAAQDIVIDESRSVAIMDEGQRTGVLLVDLETREKIILSKSGNDF